MKKDHLEINQDTRRKDQALFDSKWIAKNLPYVFFLIFLAMLYIANAHYTKKKIRQIALLKDEIKELNWNYMSVKSDVIYQSTYTKLRSQVEQWHLSNDGQFPKKIVK